MPPRRCAAANARWTAANQAVAARAAGPRGGRGTRLAEATEQGVLGGAGGRCDKDRAAAAESGELGEWNRKRAVGHRRGGPGRPGHPRAAQRGHRAGRAGERGAATAGRKAAVALTTTGGEWSRDAAAEALAGGEVELRSWLTSDRRFAAGQDDRARVWRLVDTLPDGPEKTAAQAALDGDDAAVEAFLRTRNYSGQGGQGPAGRSTRS